MVEIDASALGRWVFLERYMSMEIRSVHSYEAATLAGLIMWKLTIPRNNSTLPEYLLSHANYELQNLNE